MVFFPLPIRSSDLTVLPSWSITSKDGILSPIFNIMNLQMVWDAGAAGRSDPEPRTNPRTKDTNSLRIGNRPPGRLAETAGIPYIWSELDLF